MDGPTILLLLRLLSALLLLAFLGCIAWFLQRDLAALAHSSAQKQASYGFVDVTQDDETIRHRLRSVVSVGRIRSNTIVLDNSYTSAQHALITRRDAQWWLEDLNSRNGTLLNDIPVSEPTVITYGDSIVIGEVQLTLTESPN